MISALSQLIASEMAFLLAFKMGRAESNLFRRDTKIWGDTH